MPNPPFDIRSFIRVERVGAALGARPGPSPFDLRFKSQPLNAEQREAISGTCIYLISHGDVVVYLGKYQPANGDIISDRWSRHLQTITARGYDIGFGGRDAKLRLTALLKAVTDTAFRQVLQTAFDCDTKRFRDTGYTTSPNRLRFASENWGNFSTATPERLLDDFAFRLVRMRPARGQADAKAEVSAIERQVLRTFKPCCNREYRHAIDAESRAFNTAQRIVDAVHESIEAVTRKGPTHCVTLQG